MLLTFFALLGIASATNITCDMISVSSLGQTNVIQVSSTSGNMIYKDAFDIVVADSTVTAFSIPHRISSSADIGLWSSTGLLTSLAISVITTACPLGAAFTVALFPPSCDTILVNSNGTAVLAVFTSGSFPTYSMASNNGSIWFHPVADLTGNYFLQGFAKSGLAPSNTPVTFNLTTSYCLRGKSVTVNYVKPSCSDFGGNLTTTDYNWFKVYDYTQVLIKFRGLSANRKLSTNDSRFTLYGSSSAFQLVSSEVLSTVLTISVSSKYCTADYVVKFLYPEASCNNWATNYTVYNSVWNLYQIQDWIGSGAFNYFGVEFDDPSFRFRVYQTDSTFILFQIGNNSHTHANVSATVSTPYCTRTFILPYQGEPNARGFPVGTPLPWTS